MTDRPTPADAADPALKREGISLDSGLAMRTHELRLRIEQSQYSIDPHAVADAMLRHAISHRRWWNPCGVRATPPADSVTPGGPSATTPTHVSSAARSAAPRSSGATQTHSS
jgi:hypothetical protein